MQAMVWFSIVILVTLVAQNEAFKLSQNKPELSDMSCFGRCKGTDGLYKTQCVCNETCLHSWNCCQDYEEVCKPKNKEIEILVTDEKLQEFSEKLLQIEKNHYIAEYRYKHGDKVNIGDCSVAKLGPLLDVDGASYQRPTISKLSDIYDGGIFHADVSIKETYTRQNALINAFIDALFETDVWKLAEEFLKENKISVSKDIFFELWFGLYSRADGSNIKGSSGFEHMFLGEIKKKQTSGFHNWIFYKIEEEHGRIDYFGKSKFYKLPESSTPTPGWTKAISVIDATFNWKPMGWNGDASCKAGGSMFIGTSPEFELALYTVCFFTHFNSKCPIKLYNNKRIKIQTQPWPARTTSRKNIASAYPMI